MKKFTVKFQREFEVQVEAETPAIAQQLTKQIMAQFPEGTCKLLSIVAEDYIEGECAGCKEAVKSGGKPPHGKPDGGGTPGATVVRVPVLVDQVAEAA